jgi:hypothetical protein
MDATVVFGRVTDTHLTAAERLAAAGQLRGWLDATVLALTVEVAAVGDVAEMRLQDSARLSARSVEREIRRARVVDAVPALGDALGEGEVSVDHVDVLERALKRLDPDQRFTLLSGSEDLVHIAREETPERFERVVQGKVARLLTEADREARLAKQRRDTRVRTWVDKVTGMWNIRGEFDPVTGMRLQILIDQRHDALFAGQVPDEAPADPLDRAQYLRGLALVDLIDRPGAGARPEVVVVLRPDAVSGETEVDWRLPIDVPRAVLEQLITDPATLITPVIIMGDLVVHAGGALNLGRSTRIANRAQRRALQAVHSTCAIDGCDVPFHRCEIHHVTWWRNGGRTDLSELQPVCDRHHALIHQGKLDLPPPRIRAA